MTAPKLVLHPLAPAIPAAAPAALLQALHDLGFVGAAFDLDGRRHYRTGPAFLDHVSFLGCAPSIELEPPATEPEAAARAGHFCHIHLQTQVTPPQLRLRSGHRPRCRSCRGEIDPAALAGAEITCPACGHLSTPERLNWRQSGGYARLFLDIWGIHTAEAVPGDRLLDRLGQSSSSPWAFFYIED